REGIACELEMTGQLVVARSRGGVARLRATINALQALSLPCEVLDRDDLEQRVYLALPSAPQAPAAIRLPLAGTLHPLRLLHGLAERVVARGGHIFERARVRSLAHGARVRLELESGAAVSADRGVGAAAGCTPQSGLVRGGPLP